MSMEVTDKDRMVAKESNMRMIGNWAVAESLRTESFPCFDLKLVSGAREIEKERKVDEMCVKGLVVRFTWSHLLAILILRKNYSTVLLCPTPLQIR